MSQSLCNNLLHIVFSTKKREALIDPQIEPELFAFITSIIAEQKCYVHKINGTEDHVHILVNLHKTIPLSTFIETIKKNSSRWIKEKSNKYRTFLWQRGFGAFSVSHSHLHAVDNYIANQKEHHKTIDFKEEFICLLKRNNVMYDEKYVWD